MNRWGLKRFRDLKPDALFLQALNRLVKDIDDRSAYVPLVVREYVNATSAAVSRFLPDGNKNLDKDYYYVKTDASANAVTIYPFGTQLINAAATYALAAQGNSAWLAFDPASQTWWLV